MLLELLVLIVCFSTVLADVTVTTPDGTIRGFETLSSRNHTYYAFLQIPYAQPPVGQLRFQSPQPVKPWSGILNATEEKKMCYQMPSESEMESEDCLYLNVYTPINPNKRKTSSKLPVMFYIHGGGFINGYGLYSVIRPNYFMDNDVVVVTIEYRLGPFGFLSTGDSVLPGNYGLKDQTMALKWVRQNIRCFGGDPDKVTIFGQSSGGVSVGYHILSQQSRGLFRAAIQQSGSVLSPHGYQRHARNYAYMLAKYLDPSFSDNASSQDLLDLLQNATAKEINAANDNFKPDPDALISTGGSIFAPVIEGNHEDAFVTGNMYESLQKGDFNKVPLVLGITSEEAVSQAGDLEQFKSSVKKYDNNVTLLVQEDMHVDDPTNRTLTGEDIRRIYTNGSLQNNLGAAVKWSSDADVGRPVIKHAQLQSAFTDVYFYQFSYDGALGDNDVYVEGADRVGHSEDLRYLWAFNDTLDIQAIDAKDLRTLDRYVKLFTNFAKTLNPTPKEDYLLENIEWPKVHVDNFRYLDIDEELTIKINPKEPQFSKWVEVYDKWAIPPFDTY